MADPTKLELGMIQQRAVQEIAEHQAAVERHRSEILGLLIRRQKNQINMVLAEQVIVSLKEKQGGTPIEIQRRIMDAASQRATIERQSLENMEGDQRITIHREQIEAEDVAIVAARSRLIDQENAHGRIKFQDVDD